MVLDLPSKMKRAQSDSNQHKKRAKLIDDQSSDSNRHRRSNSEPLREEQQVSVQRQQHDCERSRTEEIDQRQPVMSEALMMGEEDPDDDVAGAMIDLSVEPQGSQHPVEEDLRCHNPDCKSKQSRWRNLNDWGRHLLQCHNAKVFKCSEAGCKFVSTRSDSPHFKNVHTSVKPRINSHEPLTLKNGKALIFIKCHSEGSKYTAIYLSWKHQTNKKKVDHTKKAMMKSMQNLTRKQAEMHDSMESMREDNKKLRQELEQAKLELRGKSTGHSLFFFCRVQ